MYSPGQSGRVRGSAGDPLPTAFKTLESAGIVFRRGELGLICAPPGIGKSALALNLAVKPRIPTLYFSADSNSFTQQTRMISICTGRTLEQSGELVLAGDLSTVAEKLKAVPIRFEYDATPDIDLIELNMAAFHAVYGEYPSQVVIDNLTDVLLEGDDENKANSLEGLTRYLHKMARDTDSFVLALHHVNGTHVNGDKPIPLGANQNQVHKVPEMVLTMFRPGPGRVGISAVKNRSNHGADPSGETYVELDFDGSRATFSDPTWAA